MKHIIRNTIAVICLAFLLLGCGRNGSDGSPPEEPEPSNDLAYADNGVPAGELDIITYVPMGDIPICWQLPKTDVKGNPFLEDDQFMFRIFACRVSSRDPWRKSVKQLEDEIYLDQVIQEDGSCCTTIWLDEDGEWVIGIQLIVIRYGIPLEAKINWSDEVENQGLVGLWRVCDPDQMPPGAATELKVE